LLQLVLLTLLHLQVLRNALIFLLLLTMLVLLARGAEQPQAAAYTALVECPLH
jgi:hypothetical protein